MSFSNRLTIFFLIIVALPMMVTAGLVLRISGQLEAERADATLSQALTSAVNLYRDAREDRLDEANLLRGSSEFRRAWGQGSAALRQAVEPSLRRFTSITARDANGRVIWRLGSRDRGLAVIRLKASDPRASVKTLELATLIPQRFLNEASQITGRDLVLSTPDGRVLASTHEAINGQSPPDGSVKIAGTAYRIQHVVIDSQAGQLQLAMLVAEEGGGFGGQPLLLVLLGALLLLAIALAFMLRRSMQRQLRTMVNAAKRIGDGDFSVEVPASGRDEMSELASEFNSMGVRLKEHIRALHSQRQQSEAALYRFGEAMASNLNREALLRITLQAALDTCRADYGQITSDSLTEVIDGGEAEDDLKARMQSLAGESRDSKEPAAATFGEWQVISSPILDAEHRYVTAVISIARRGEEFDRDDGERLSYLASQTSVSLENISLHELVSRQAITDGLTGLHNRRSFDHLIEKEAMRMSRFGHPLSLLMIDVDNFKQVNDTYGHTVGDQVLRAIADHLQTESRAVDEPARYGGEEFAVLLPETNAEEAAELGERLRAAIASEQIETDAGMLEVTVSVGISTYPDDADTPEDLISAADSALYRAKSTGKNKAVSFNAGQEG